MIMPKMKAKGFTLTELIICMGIMLLVVYLSMNPNIDRQTGKQEAERLEIWLARIFQQAARTRAGFNILVYNNQAIGVQWNHSKVKDRTRRSTKFDDEFKTTPGCTYSYNRDRISYNVSNNGVAPGTNGTFTVTGQDGSVYYVIISKTGRVRLSDTRPGTDE